MVKTVASGWDFVVSCENGSGKPFLTELGRYCKMMVYFARKAGGLQWRVMDVCAVFANAFDNAIEACEKLPQEDRYIHLTIKATEQFWFLTMTNPVKEKVNTKRLFQRIGGYTSKADNKQHGIGTYNMKRVVESHGGLVKATCQEHQFTLEIVLDKFQALKAS